jgi:hypothetical protein
VRKLLSNRALLGAAVCAPMAALYAMGLQRSVWTGDSAELVTAAYTLGIPHPTGYPIYVWLGKLFTLIPVGGVALRLNAMSLVFATATLYFTYLIVAREVEEQSGSALLACVGGLLAVMVLGTARPFWDRAEVAEVYSLSTFLLALFVYLFFRWLDGASARILLLASLVYGLGVGAHMSNGLLLPALLVIVLLTTRSLRLVGWSAVFIGVGLSQYVFVLLRSALEVPYIHPDAWFFRGDSGAGTESPLYNWLWFIGGGQWRHETAYSLAAAVARAGRLLEAALAEFGPVGVCLVVLGVVLCISRLRPRAKPALLLAVIICGLFYFSTYTPAGTGMVLPFFVALAILAGLGTGGLGAVLSRAPRTVGLASPVALVVTVVLAAVVVVTCIARPRIDFSERSGPAILVSRMIHDLPPGSTVDGLRWKYGKIVEYYEIVEGRTVPFQAMQCDLNRIPGGTCYAVDTAAERYKRMGFNLELVVAAGGSDRLYLVLPPAK